MADDTPPAPWERQRGESRQAFEAFRTYRDMGAKRTVRKTAQELSKSETTIKGWSAKWSWVARTTAYDDMMDARWREAQMTELQAMAQRHISIATNMQGLALGTLRNLSTAVAAGSASALTPKEAAQFVKIAVDIERMSRDAPSARIAIEGAETPFKLDDQGAELAEAVLRDANVRAAARDVLRAAARARPSDKPGASGDVERANADVRSVRSRKKG